MVYKSPDVSAHEELKFLNPTVSNLENACDLGVYFDHKLSNIDIPTRISNNKRSLIDHCFSTNDQITSWKVCLPPLDIDHNVIFFHSKFFC